MEEDMVMTVAGSVLVVHQKKKKGGASCPE